MLAQVRSAAKAKRHTCASMGKKSFEEKLLQQCFLLTRLSEKTCRLSWVYCIDILSLLITILHNLFHFGKTLHTKPHPSSRQRVRLYASIFLFGIVNTTRPSISFVLSCHLPHLFDSCTIVVRSNRLCGECHKACTQSCLTLA